MNVQPTNHIKLIFWVSDIPLATYIKIKNEAPSITQPIAILPTLEGSLP